MSHASKFEPTFKAPDLCTNNLESKPASWPEADASDVASWPKADEVGIVGTALELSADESELRRSSSSSEAIGLPPWTGTAGTALQPSADQSELRRSSGSSEAMGLPLWTGTAGTALHPLTD